jgi:ABC-type branched-subunit amino acid transport system permease subunit
MIDAMMRIVTMQPTRPPSDGDVFYAPTPDEVFAIPGASSGPASFGHLSEWLPILAGVAVGVVLGAVIALIIIRVRRRRRLGDNRSKALREA